MDGKYTIRIFLAEGNPTGLRTLETMNWGGRGIIIPRESMDVSQSRDDLEAQGVYFLLGENEETGEAMLYIGETENLKNRIKEHNRTKDFWSTAICFLSTQGSLNKAHAKFLEEFLITEAKQAGRVKLENNTHPSQTKLSESEEADVRVFAEYIKLMLSAVGYTFLKSLKVDADEKGNIYLCEGPDASARAIYTNEGLVVLEGSRARKEVSAGSKEYFTKLRPILVENGTLKEEGVSYVFTKDTLFNSPSTAAQNVLGRNANGWTEWKRESDKKTLDAIVRKSEQ